MNRTGVIYLILALLIPGTSFSEDIDESSIKYMSYLGMKSQIQFFKKYFKEDESCLAKIRKAENEFIENNKLYTEIKNSPPENAQLLDSKNEEIQAKFRKYAARELSKVPNETLCEDFSQKLSKLSFERLLEASKRKFDQYVEKAKSSKN